MTLFKFRENLSKYRDNVNTEARLRNIQVKYNGGLYNIEKIEEDYKGDIILNIERKNFISNIMEYIKFNFIWHLNNVKICVFSIYRKIIC